MTKTEVVKLLAVISGAYPNMQVTEATVALWYELLGDLDINLALAAVKKLILESSYPPTIADIRKRVVDIITLAEDKMSAAEAWGEVEKKIRWYGYYREVEALENMTPQVAKVVRYIGWRNICLSEEPSVIRGQFLKMYQQVAEREQKERLLPLNLRDDIKRISDARALNQLEEGCEDADEE